MRGLQERIREAIRTGDQVTDLITRAAQNPDTLAQIWKKQQDNYEDGSGFAALVTNPLKRRFIALEKACTATKVGVPDTETTLPQANKQSRTVQFEIEIPDEGANTRIIRGLAVDTGIPVDPKRSGAFAKFTVPRVNRLPQPGTVYFFASSENNIMLGVERNATQNNVTESMVLLTAKLFNEFYEKQAHNPAETARAVHERITGVESGMGVTIPSIRDAFREELAGYKKINETKLNNVPGQTDYYLQAQGTDGNALFVALPFIPPELSAKLTEDDLEFLIESGEISLPARLVRNPYDENDRTVWIAAGVPYRSEDETSAYVFITNVLEEFVSSVSEE